MNFFKCCHKCTERTQRCHSTCEKYIEQKAQWEHIKFIRNKETQEQIVLDSVKNKLHKIRRKH